MKPRPARRSILLLAGLALSLAATGWLAAQEQQQDAAVAAESPPVPFSPRQGTAAEAPPGNADSAGLQLEALRRREGGTEIRELFAARTWQTAARPAAIALAAPAPAAAPDLPLAYLGKMLHGGETTVFLSWQDRRYTVKAGDFIDRSYRVDSINGPLMTLTYLPLETQQTMHIGEAP